MHLRLWNVQGHRRDHRHACLGDADDCGFHAMACSGAHLRRVSACAHFRLRHLVFCYVNAGVLHHATAVGRCKAGCSYHSSNGEAQQKSDQTTGYHLAYRRCLGADVGMLALDSFETPFNEPCSQPLTWLHLWFYRPGGQRGPCLILLTTHLQSS